MNKKTHHIKQKFVIFILLSFLLTHSLSAHEGRHKNILDKVSITKLATNIVTNAIEQKKIDASWENANLLEAKTKNINNTDEWLVIFQNDKTEDAKNKIYLFFSLDGEFLAMNYTGT